MFLHVLCGKERAGVTNRWAISSHGQSVGRNDEGDHREQEMWESSGNESAPEASPSVTG